MEIVTIILVCIVVFLLVIVIKLIRQPKKIELPEML